MKNEKILNFLIALFLTLIILNFFLPSKKEAQNENKITFSTLNKEYTIPNVPTITVKNWTTKEFTFNTCNNLEIYKDSAKIEKIETSNPWFCKDITTKPNESSNINFEAIAKIFSVKWDYELKLNSWETKNTISFSQTEKWFFNNLFSNLFYWPVYNLFVLFLSKLPSHSLGLTIILVTLIIRLIVLVPQHKMMVNSKKMQSIQPKIKEIQTKYKWDQWKIWMELLELYKKEKVNPMWSCLPMLIQLPLLIVLYWVVSWITSASNYYYLYSYFADFDTKIINTHFFGLDLVKQEWKSGLILAVLIWWFQWLQIKMSLTVHQKTKSHWKVVEKDIKTDDPVSEFMPDPEVMNMFMLWVMPTMLAFSSYFFPSWVGIYWLIWTIFTLVQQYVVNKYWSKSKAVTKEWHEVIIPEKKDKKVRV